MPSPGCPSAFSIPFWPGKGQRRDSSPFSAVLIDWPIIFLPCCILGLFGFLASLCSPHRRLLLRELNVRLSDANILAQRDGVAVPRESLDIDFGVDDRNVIRRLTLNFNYDDVKERDQLLTAATNKFGAPNARFSETEMAWGFWQVDESGAPSQTLDTGRPNLRLSSVDGTLTLTLIDPRF